MAQDATTLVAGDDPERSYAQGAVLAFAGKTDAAVHMIRMAIEQNYCAYSALEKRSPAREAASHVGVCGAVEIGPLLPAAAIAASGASTK